MHPMNINRVSIAKTFSLQACQYRETLLIRNTVSANSESLSKVSISNLGHFMLERITGRFDTLHLDGGNIVDDGVNRLVGKLVDGSNQRQLFGDYVPLDLILSPGRSRSALATNNLTSAAPSNNLFFPFDFRYMFAMNSEIQLYVKNSSDVDQSFAIALVGWRVRPEENKSSK